MSNASSKVPVLGNIPIVKGLFSNNGKNRKNTELVVFIVPHDYTSDNNLTEEVLSNATDLSRERNTVINSGQIIPMESLQPEMWQGMEKQFTQNRNPEPQPQNQPPVSQTHEPDCPLVDNLAEAGEFEWTCRTQQP
jgi:type II secretory pathway component GspD/PulD (secretin)